MRNTRRSAIPGLAGCQGLPEQRKGLDQRVDAVVGFQRLDRAYDDGAVRGRRLDGLGRLEQRFVDAKRGNEDRAPRQAAHFALHGVAGGRQGRRMVEIALQQCLVPGTGVRKLVNVAAPR